MPILRACRSSSLKGVARNTSTKRVISSTVCIRPPTATTCASLCWRARTAVSSDQTIAQRMPVSISLGLWSTLLIYLVSIPLGIRKAVRDGTRFDVATSAAVLIGYAIPGFLFAIMLVVLFAGGSFVQWFPMRGLTSMGSGVWSMPARAIDYLWHIVLPTTAIALRSTCGRATSVS